MQRGVTSVGQDKFKILLLLVSAAGLLGADQRCVICHPKEVAGYQEFGMARSVAPIGMSAVTPDGSFEHKSSQTRFFIRSSGTGMTQGMMRKGESVEQSAAFAIGSGNHAFGYLMQVGDHVFQSPLSYYTNRRLWDVAPGYELDPHPDFARPVTAECLFCHSGKSLPVADSLNRFAPQVFSVYAISCERCHGEATAHLKKPVPGSILNPAKLSGEARASICEQCHLSGEARIPNPGKSITDFTPGHVLEDFYTIYVAAKSSGESIKVISHSEQLAASQCARKSGDKLWCGTCHNPHDKPTNPVAYFRERCLSCHGATLAKEHGVPGRDCIGCHMQKLPAKDGGHTAFTDHKIARTASAFVDASDPDTLKAWREPDSSVQNRNLALALVTAGLQNRSSAEVIQGYKMINRMEKDFPSDASLLTMQGLVLMKGKQPGEALARFQRVIALKPNYPPYYVNAATALMALSNRAAAIEQLQKALSLDPLLQPAVQLLCQIYRESGRDEDARSRQAQYEAAMGIRHQ